MVAIVSMAFFLRYIKRKRLESSASGALDADGKPKELRGKAVPGTELSGPGAHKMDAPHGNSKVPDGGPGGGQIF